MSNGRLIGLTAALLIAVAIAAGSYLHFGMQASAPDGSAAPPGDIGSAPATTLTSGQLIDFWRARVERDQRDYISFTELAGAFIRRARETGEVDSYTRAEAALERALGLNPRYSGALAYQASLLFARHDFESALNAAERIYSLNSGAAHALAVAGDANLELGRYSEAESAYARLLELSESAPVFSRLAHLRELQGRPEEAIELMMRALELAEEEQGSPESLAWYRLQLGQILFNVGDIDAAAEQFRSSLDSFPGYVHALAGLARVTAARGDYTEAIDLYADVTARQPIVEYVVAFGEVYRAAGREGEAQRQYDLVAAIDSLYRANGIHTGLETALFNADQGIRIEEAVAQARAVYETRPGSIRAADVLSWALYKAGSYHEALVYSKEAARLGTQDPLLLYHAGMINYKAGNRGAARDYLERAIDINPRFSILYAEEAASTLEKLRSAVKEE